MVIGQGSTSENLVLVAGATGGVGQLTVGKLLEQGASVRILTRNRSKAQTMFDNRVQIAIGNLQDIETLSKAMEGVTHIICCTGTTAFPSARWEFIDVNTPWDWLQIFLNPQRAQERGRNSPFKVDAEGVANLVKAAPPGLKHFIFVSSCGVSRKDRFPFNILNAFGVLDAKHRGEQAIKQSGLPYTILRPARLIDGPYTSYDLNTLMQAKTDGKLAVVLGTGDTLSGDSSRIDVAAACVACLSHEETKGKSFEIVNQGVRPAVTDWEALFAQL